MTKKGYYIIIIILLLLNIASWRMWWVNPREEIRTFFRNTDREENRKTDDAVLKFMVETLGLSDGQTETIGRLRSDYFKQRRFFMNKVLDDREKLLEKSLKSDQDIMSDSLLLKIAENRFELDKLTYQHLRKIRDVCDSTQKIALDSLYQFMVRKDYYKREGSGGKHYHGKREGKRGEHPPK